MSLTRKQWEEMWKAAETIQRNASLLKSPPVKQAILYEVKRIKDWIQQVIGQME